MSPTATTSKVEPSRPCSTSARKTRRPMRPKPLIATLTAIDVSFSSCARDRRSLTPEILDGRELALHRLHQIVEIRERVPVGVESPVQPAVVAEERDAQGLIREQGHQRVAGE